MIEVARNPTWQDRMEGPIHAIKVERPAFYYDLLNPHASKLDLWETEYVHVMKSPAAILEWIRGTGLRPFLEALSSAEQKQRFEKLFLAGLTKAYPAQTDGCVLFPFRRLFILAYR